MMWSSLLSRILKINPYFIVGVLAFLLAQTLIQRYVDNKHYQNLLLQANSSNALLNHLNITKDEQIAQLMEHNSAILSGFSEQRDEFRKLKDEVESVKQWAHVELPADINRLLKHETTIGAAGIISTMPKRDPLPVESSRPKDE